MRMKRTLVAVLTALVVSIGYAQPELNQGGYPIIPVPFTSVRMADGFWGQRLKVSREVTIPLAFRKSEETGRIENFVRAVHPSDTYKVEGFPFDDTDIYKTIEGASYSLQTYPDKRLESYIDSVLLIVAAAQEPDGYLYTSRTMNPAHPHNWAGKERWEKEEELSHELYNLGHMIEGAVAHYQATGKRNFLDIAIKYADCVCAAIGLGKGQIIKVPGHQIAEMALAKLYLVTGNRKYLDEAKFFLDERGRTVHKDIYSQSHKPVIEQDEAVGHAVRAAYMYSGMADVAALTGDTAYIRAIDRIWENVIGKKLYITGGIGAKHDGEAFGGDYELPNLTAYNETCAAIANVFWNYRLFLLHGQSKYIDVLERTLYNGLISGVSLDGGTFFYPNPLESDGIYKFNQGACERQPWFGCACCPSNISRFIPSLPGYIYAVKDNNVYINLFAGNTAELEIAGRRVEIKQTTTYPWEGAVKIELLPEVPIAFTLKIRIPGWVRNQVVPSDLYHYADGKNPLYTIMLNGKKVKGTVGIDGYFSINRKWKKGDRVEADFDMQPRIVVANEKVEADAGCVAVERGPLVYCAEAIDNSFNVLEESFPVDSQFTVEYIPGMLSGISLLRAGKWTLIPYYAWNHRGVGKMAVWLKQAPTFVQWAKIPPMGWNSWDCYGSTVTEDEVKANADYMASHLKKYGWEYVVVDIRWFVENDKAGGYNQTDPHYVLDGYGRYLPAVNRFPSATGEQGFRPLANYIHSKGLKFGIHLMRGVPKVAVERKLPIKGTNITADKIFSPESQCTWLRDNYSIKDTVGAQEYYNSLMELYASWGVDFLKIDDLSRPYHKTEIEMIRKAIDRTGRPIVLSMSPGETPVNEAMHAKRHANMWRMVDDVWDTWGHITHLMKVAENWYPYIALGTWPDCDMIPLGRISIRGERGQDRQSRLTHDEQYSLMTFFTIFRSPLMFGGDLPSLDDFTRLLLTNEEVLRMHRDSKNVRQIFRNDSQLVVTSENSKTSEKYLALFNLKDYEVQDVTVKLKDLELTGKHRIVDLWNNSNLGTFENEVSFKLNPHACVLLVIE